MQQSARAKRTVRSKETSGASERANEQASGPVLRSRFLAFLTHRASVAVFLTRVTEERRHNSEAERCLQRRKRVGLKKYNVAAGKITAHITLLYN